MNLNHEQEVFLNKGREIQNFDIPDIFGII